MLDEKEERIRAEAYRRWEQEGRPHGQHDRHWQEASAAVGSGEKNSILESEGTTQAVKTPKGRVAKPKATKALPEAPVAVVAAPKRSRAKKAAAE